MLQSLRDKAQGWIAWVIIGLVAITFVFFGAGTMFTGRSQSVVAKVNGTKIYEHELDSAYQRFLHQAGSESLRSLDSTYVKKELLQTLIDDTLLSQNATKMGMIISPMNMQEALNSISFLKEDGHFSPRLYARFLENSNFTDNSFKKLLRDSLLKQQLQQGVVQSEFALSEEIETLVRFFLQKRDFRWLTIARGPFEKDVKVTPEAIKQYYDEHTNDFLTNEQVALEYVHLSPQNVMAKYQPKESDIKHYYDENLPLFGDVEKVQVAHILIAVPKDADDAQLAQAKERLAMVQSKIQAKEDFAQVAKANSDDKGSAQNGGTLDWFTHGEMVPAFEKGAFSLTKKGDTTTVRSDFGFHIIKLLDKQKQKARAYSEVKNEIVTKLKQQALEEQLINTADQLSTLAFEHPESLQAVQDKLGLKVQKTPLFDRQNPPNDPLLQNPAVLNAAFSQSVKEDKNNSDLIKIDDENFIVIRASEYLPTKQKPLAEVESDIKVRLMQQEAESLAKAQAQKVKDALIANPEAKSQYTWQEQSDITRSNKLMAQDLLDAVFSMPYPNDKNPRLKVVQLNNGDYALIWLTKVDEPNYSSLTNEEKENYRTALARHMGELEYSLYTTELFKEAKIKEYLPKAAS